MNKPFKTRQFAVFFYSFVDTEKKQIKEDKNNAYRIRFEARV